MRFWAFILTFGICFSTLGQSNYTDYSSSSKTLLLQEDFDAGSTLLWTGSSSSYRGQVQNGYYLWECTSETGMIIPFKYELDESRDYEVEADIKFVSGQDNSPMALLWGYDNSSKWTYYFDITNTQYVKLERYKGEYEAITSWMYNTVIKKNDYNRLTIRKVGSNMYFFINRSLVHTMAVEPFYGQYFAFNVPKYSTMHIDRVRINYLKKKEIVFDKGGDATNDASRYSSYTASNRTDLFYDDFVDNRKNWWQGNDANYWAKIENGYLYWEVKGNQSMFLPYNLPSLTGNEDFEIELKAKFVRGSGDDEGYGLRWGKPSDDWHSYVFHITNTGYYKIFKSQDYPEEYVPWTHTYDIKEYAYNTITIRKVERTYYFFMNKKLVHSMPFQSFMGNQIAIETPSGSVVHADYVRVSKLEQKKAVVENIPPTIVITEPALARGFKVVEVDTRTTKVAGKATDSDGIREVLVNGKKATLSSDGSFSANITLTEGANAILVKATDNRFKSTVKSFTIDHEEKSRVTANQKRLALVIGNGAYQHGGVLKNPVNDANGMKVALEQLGFEVFKYENCDQKTMKRAIDEFGKKLQGYDVGLFFYAGHGVQVNGNNYLIPIDASLENENEVEYDCVRADRVLMTMETAETKTNLVVLDACRNNPFERSWSRSGGGKGLAFMNAPKGSLIAYATSPGSTASDGAGDNGLYTEALLKEITKPNITILEMFQNVRMKVMNDSGNAQTPWESTSLTGNFYFKKE